MVHRRLETEFLLPLMSLCPTRLLAVFSSAMCSKHSLLGSMPSASMTCRKALGTLECTGASNDDFPVCVDHVLGAVKSQGSSFRYDVLSPVHAISSLP